MKKELAKKLLNKTREDYNRIAGDFSGKRKYPWKHSLFLFKYIKKGDKVLDLGCGNGRLYQVLEGVQYVGLDFSKELIEIAKKNYPQADFILGPGLNLPFSDNCFDKVFSVAVLHHIPSEELRLKFLKEAKRVLKKNGLLVLTVWKTRKFILKYSFLKILGLNKMDFGDVFIPWGGVKRYIHCFSKKGLRKLAKKAGLRVQEIGVDRKAKNRNIYLVLSCL